MGIEDAKKAASIKAAEMISDGMRVGLGTGTTVQFFVQRLIERCHEGLVITAAASSERTKAQALGGGIQLIEEFTELDITVDGADEIDPQMRMIKGGGGALLREKILASSSKRMIVIVDEHKRVAKLGRAKVPVEVARFGYKATASKLKLPGAFRLNGKALYETDNGNYIYDVHLDAPIEDPEKLHWEMIAIPGVIETGLFFGLDVSCIVGFEDGRVV